MIRFLMGYIIILVRGEQTERFLNLCKNRGIVFRNLCLNENGELKASMNARDFFRLYPIHQKTKVHIHILEKHGMPFFFVRNKKRKAFFIGIILCFFLIFGLSARIWNIHIEGNIKNSTPEILSFLEEQGITHGILKNEIDCSALAAAVREKYEEVAWVSARIEGTRLILTIQEGDFLDTIEDMDDDPCNITADIDGEIVKMVTRSGVPLKKTGETCEKGDILVLGRVDIMNDSQEVVRYEYVQADADIYVRHFISYYYELPLNYEKEQFTGESKRGVYLKVGDYFLEFGIQKKDGWKITAEDISVRLTENFVLPVSLGRITAKKYEKYKSSYSEEEAKDISWQHLQRYEEKLMEKGVQISANNVTIEVNHKNCISSGRLEVIEKIGIEAPVEILEQPLERTTTNGE